MTDFENREETIETAAERDAHYWKGRALHPFSFSRQAAVQRVMVDGASSLENSVAVIYACTLEPKELDRARGEKEVAAFRERMSQWADAEGINIANSEPVFQLVGDIWREIEASQFKIASKPGEKAEPAPKND